MKSLILSASDRARVIRQLEAVETWFAETDAKRKRNNRQFAMDCLMSARMTVSEVAPTECNCSHARRDLSEHDETCAMATREGQ